MISIYWPQTLGEGLGFAVAVFTALLGLFAFISPIVRFVFRLLKASAPDMIIKASASVGGVFLALGLGTILFAQPFVTIVLGGVWAIMALGHIVSMVFDRAISPYNIAATVLQLLLAAAALAGPLGYIA
jgi:hypothetical protein